MRVAVTGSIATDHLMTFPGRFAEQLLPDQLDRLSVSFLVSDLEVRRGGVAANICYGMGLLGERPVLVGAVGDDFEDYRAWLDRHGVDTTHVRVSTLRHTARFVCTTDADQNQLASFYAGAMAEAREIELAPVGPLDLVLVSPNDPAAMVRHTEECRRRGVPFGADPSQQLASLEPEQVRALVDGARYLFTNAYETAMVAHKSGWDDDAILARVGTWVSTHGKDGVVVRRRGEPDLRVAVARAGAVSDPTGVGDAFRAGFLAATSWGLELTRACQVGATLATACLESVGPQEYGLDGFGARLAAAYGDEAAREVAPHLPTG